MRFTDKDYSLWKYSDLFDGRDYVSDRRFKSVNSLARRIRQLMRDDTMQWRFIVDTNLDEAGKAALSKILYSRTGVHSWVK